jgi:hypothetical protein
MIEYIGEKLRLWAADVTQTHKNTKTILKKSAKK